LAVSAGVGPARLAAATAADEGVIPAAFVVGC
jgi:hypothetical protein